MQDLLYKPSDLVIIAQGAHVGREAHVVMSWDHENWVLEVHNDEKDMAILKLHEFAPLNADNETYTERMLPSFDDYM